MLPSLLITIKTTLPNTQIYHQIHLCCCWRLLIPKYYQPQYHLCYMWNTCNIILNVNETSDEIPSTRRKNDKHKCQQQQKSSDRKTTSSWWHSLFSSTWAEVKEMTTICFAAAAIDYTAAFPINHNLERCKQSVSVCIGPYVCTPHSK